jgi:hypothetical protein
VPTPDTDAIAELDAAIAAHWLWLRGEGIPTPVHDDHDGSASGTRMRSEEPPKELLLRLGFIEALVKLEEAKAFSKGKRTELIAAVLESLCRLSGFRSSSVGLERVREDFERRRALGEGPEGSNGAPIDLSLDASLLKIVEAGFAELARQSGFIHASLRKFRTALAKRARGFARKGFHPELQGVGRAMFLSWWIEGRVIDLLIDLDRFRQETGGRPSSGPLSYSDVPDAKAVRRAQVECRRRVENGGASAELILELFPGSQPEAPKRRPKGPIRKQTRTVGKRAKSARQ